MPEAVGEAHECALAILGGAWVGVGEDENFERPTRASGERPRPLVRVPNLAPRPTSGRGVGYQLTPSCCANRRRTFSASTRVASRCTRAAARAALFVSPWRIDAVADRRRGVRERSEVPLVPAGRVVKRRPYGFRLRRRDPVRMEAARVLYGPVGIQEGVVAAVAEAETEILEREPERWLTDEAPRGLGAGRGVAGARAVQLRDRAGLIALVDRSHDVRAS